MSEEEYEEEYEAEAPQKEVSLAKVRNNIINI